MQKFIIIGGEVITLTLGADKQYRDEDNTIWALRDDNTADPVDRCGVGLASLSPDNPLTPFCTIHDYEYSSGTWQIYHTRQEADQQLRDNIANSPTLWSFMARPFYYLSRAFGGKFWEVKKTNN